jgi:hypothetical protein
MKPNTFLGVIADVGIDEEPVHPICPPSVETDQQPAKGGHHVARDVAFGVQSELIKDLGADRPDLYLGHEPCIILGGEV